MRINPIQGQQIHQAQPARSAVVDLIAGATLSGIAGLFTPSADRASVSEQNRQVGQSLAKVGHSKAQAA